MVRVFVRHSVADYARWRQEYDSFGQERGPLGVRGDAVFQTVDDPNEVTVWHDFDTLEQAQAFVTSDALMQAMNRAGVKDQPDIWFVIEAPEGVPA
jgi:hypothetical protein